MRVFKVGDRVQFNGRPNDRPVGTITKVRIDGTLATVRWDHKPQREVEHRMECYLPEPPERQLLTLIREIDEDLNTF